MLTIAILLWICSFACGGTAVMKEVKECESTSEIRILYAVAILFFALFGVAVLKTDPNDITRLLNALRLP